MPRSSGHQPGWVPVRRSVPGAAPTPLSLTREIDANGPTPELCPIHRLARALSRLRSREGHKTKTSRPTGIAVGHDFGIHHLTKRGKGIS